MGFFVCLFAFFTGLYVVGCSKCVKLLGGFCVWSRLGTSQLKTCYVKEINGSVTKGILDGSFLMETEGYRAYCDVPCSAMNPVCSWQEVISHS